jgi:hypothetical protein
MLLNNLWDHSLIKQTDGILPALMAARGILKHVYIHISFTVSVKEADDGFRCNIAALSCCTSVQLSR